ncbi:hypothetical protein [Curtobacterium sp. MCBD17_040]|uniref:hypothetical protein n=1 Tax=Curtobacterium sp. MCBD17_040 TaxID=2175674 RepID=UPI000DA8147C|nr:hypothetical protein [Curtobacterium sp. MCBD17_040]WIB65903.1 hypothetical protein DEI94_17460 [Curtobacterium sp. MCBD17_040]
MLLVGGTFAVAGVISNGKDLNAKKDLDGLVTAARVNFNDEGVQYFRGGGQSQTDGTTVYGATPTMAQSAGQLIAQLSDATTATAFVGCGATFTEFVRSATGAWFWENSAATGQNRIPSPWPSSAPSTYPASCYWPSTAIDAPAGASTGTPTTLLSSNATLTNNVSYAGQTWTRAITNAGFTESAQVRTVVDPSTLSAGTQYEADVPVANDSTASVWVELDWCDALLTYYRIPAGTTETVRTLGIPQGGAVYGSTYRFADISPQSGITTGVLFQLPTVRPLS